MSRLSRVLPVLAAVALLAPLTAAAQDAPRGPAFCPHCLQCPAGTPAVRPVRIRFYNQSDLSDEGLNKLVELASRIWLPYGVTLERVPSTDMDSIAVVVSPGRPQPVSREGRPVLGDTLFNARHATPYMHLWLGAAGEIASDTKAGGLPFIDLPMDERQTMLLQMLGVAFAHELGHYLLDTNEHADRGLLRAALSVRDLERPDLTRLELTPAQQRVMCAAK